MGYTCKEPRLLEEVTYTSNNKDSAEIADRLHSYIHATTQSFNHKKDLYWCYHLCS